MNHHRTLRLMERVCDHMLEGKWFVPKINPEAGKKAGTVSLFNQILQNTEAKFKAAFPDEKDPEGGIRADYYEAVSDALGTAEHHASTLATYVYTTEVLMFRASYNAASHTYVIKDLVVRPCVWETGIVRQLTNAIVQGLKKQTESQPKLQFQLSFGPSFLVSLTMEELDGNFDNETPEANQKRGNLQIYTLPFNKFEAWDTSFSGKVDETLKKKWDTAKLIDPDNEDRFAKVRSKFNALPPWKQNLIAAGMKAWSLFT